MRMPQDQLLADAVADIVKAKRACLLLHARVKHNLQKHVAQFLAQQIRVLAVNRFAGLICFLNKIFADGMVILFPVPRTAFLGTQYFHDAQQILDPVGRLAFKSGRHRRKPPFQAILAVLKYSTLKGTAFQVALQTFLRPAAW